MKLCRYPGDSTAKTLRKRWDHAQAAAWPKRTKSAAASSIDSVFWHYRWLRIVRIPSQAGVAVTVPAMYPTMLMGAPKPVGPLPQGSTQAQL